MLFFHEARVDGLSKREETPFSLTEHFLSREDFLYYQQVDFGPKPKKAGPKGEDVTPRPILVGCQVELPVIVTLVFNSVLLRVNLSNGYNYLPSYKCMLRRLQTSISYLKIRQGNILHACPISVMK